MLSHVITRRSVVALGLCFAMGAVAAAAVEIRSILVQGQAAPGMQGVYVEELFGLPVVNAANQVAFLARLSGSGVDASNDLSMWAGAADDLRLVIREGDPAAGFPAGAVHASFGYPVLNEQGHIAWYGSVRYPDGGLADGIWFGPLESPLAQVMEGDNAVGTSGVFVGFSAGPVLNAEGEFGFIGLLGGDAVDDTNNAGIWLQRPAGLELVARKGSPPDPSMPGTTFFMFYAPVLNDHGQVGIAAQLQDGVTNPADNVGLWISDGEVAAQLNDVARVGHSVPGLPDASYVSIVAATPDINNEGKLAFLASIDQAGEIRDAILVGDGTSVAPVVREGEAAPGSDPIEPFSSLYWPTLSGEDRVLFNAGMGLWGDQPDSGMWIVDQGQVRAVAIEGQAAPGTSYNFSDMGPSGQVNRAVNATGDIMLATTYPQAVWLSHGESLELLIHEGDFLSTDEFGSHEVTAIDVMYVYPFGSGNQDGRGSALNDSGNVVFKASFATGPVNGLFLGRLVEEPLEMLQALVDSVVNLEIGGSFERRLLNKLTLAIHKLSDDREANDKSAVRSLGTFISIVEGGVKSGVLTSEQAANLVSAAEDVIEALNSTP